MLLEQRFIKIQQRRDLTLVLLEEILFLSIITSEKREKQENEPKNRVGRMCHM